MKMCILQKKYVCKYVKLYVGTELQDFISSLKSWMHDDLIFGIQDILGARIKSKAGFLTE